MTPDDAAAQAAARAKVTVRSLHHLDDLRLAAGLFTSIWGADAEPPTPVHLLRAFSQSGNYVVGAWESGGLVGALVAFLGRDGGQPLLHSHILGVTPGSRGRGVGFALKQHQRSWALARDIEVVTWTFDPLVRRNAWFNLNRLGADVVSYLENFYGPMSDGINAGDESDRLLVEWRLSSERASAAALGEAVAVDTGEHLVPMPEDIVAVRRDDPASARRWREQVRRELAGALGQGYRVVGVTGDGAYVVVRA